MTYQNMLRNLGLAMVPGLICCSCWSGDSVNDKPGNLIQNGDFEVWDGSVPTAWTLSKAAIWGLDPESESKKEIRLDANQGLPVVLSQQVSVEKDRYYVISVAVIHHNRNSYFGGLRLYNQDSTILGSHRFTINEQQGVQRILSTKFFSANNTRVIVELGYPQGMDAAVMFDDVQLFAVEELATEYASPLASKLAKEVPLGPFDSLGYHGNVVGIAKYVNAVFLEPAREISITDVANQPAFEQQKKDERTKIHAEIDSLLPNSRFENYLQSSIFENAAYCQKSSLSASDILNSFGIPTKQIHMSKLDSGFHQFFEYWHPYAKKWLAFDPFYGISYVDGDGLLIGYSELVAIQEKNGIAITNVKYSQVFAANRVDDLLRTGWKSEITTQVLGDSRLSYAH